MIPITQYSRKIYYVVLRLYFENINCFEFNYTINDTPIT